MIRQSVLHNGIQVVTREFNDAAGVYMHWSLDGGSCAERFHEHGANHFLEHVRCNRETISIPLENMGCEVQATTSHQTTEMHAHVWAGHAPDMLERLLVIGLKQPIFSADAIEIERARVMAELIGYSSDHRRVFTDEINSRLFRGHRRAHAVGGTVANVATHQFERLARLHERLLAGPSITVVVAGQIKHDDIVEQVNTHLGDVPATPAPAIPPSPFRSGGLLLYRPDMGDNVEIAALYRADAQGSPRRPAHLLLEGVLAGTRQSYLMNDLSYRRHALAYGVGASYVAWKDVGVMEITLNCARKRAQYTTNAIATKMMELPDKITPHLFDVTRRTYDFKLATLTEGPDIWGSRAMNDMQYYGRVRTLNEVRNDFAAVSLDDLRNLAAEVVARKPFVAAYGDVKKLRVVEPFDAARARYMARQKAHRAG